MQFLTLVAAALGLVANVNAYTYEISPAAEPAAAAGLDKRQSNRLSDVELFFGSGCSNKETTVSTFGGGANNGQCFTFSRNVPSVRTTFLRGGCTGKFFFFFSHVLSILRFQCSARPIDTSISLHSQFSMYLTDAIRSDRVHRLQLQQRGQGS